MSPFTFGARASPTSDRARQMVIFDRLGPKAREAIRDAPWDVDVAVMIREYDRPWRDAQIRRGEFPGDLPLLDPAVDQSLADLIRDKVAQRLKAL